jgi:acetate kinase
MNINGKLDMFKNSLGQLRLSKNDVGSSAMKTTVTTTNEKSVDLALHLEQENLNKEEMLKKKKAKKEEDDKKEAVVKDESKAIERDPLKLLKLF